MCWVRLVVSLMKRNNVGLLYDGFPQNRPEHGVFVFITSLNVHLRAVMSPNLTLKKEYPTVRHRVHH
jgi:hypothetical protein